MALVLSAKAFTEQQMERAGWWHEQHWGSKRRDKMGEELRVENTQLIGKGRNSVRQCKGNKTKWVKSVNTYFGHCVFLEVQKILAVIFFIINRNR